MRTKSIILCAMILLITQIVTFAQKTEVSVQKGKVVAETATENVAIEAGRKAVLAPGAAPVVSVDNPLVEDALELYKLVEEEKQSSDLQIDSACILVLDMQKVNAGIYFETPNTKAQPENVIRLGPATLADDVQIYDLNGNLLQVDVEPLNDSSAYYTIHFKEKIDAYEPFRFVAVAQLEALHDLDIGGGLKLLWKEGPLWYFVSGNSMPNCLNYYRYILPDSAILVDANRDVVATDTVDDRIAVTIRNYTGPYSDGLCIIAFLWPDKDGTTLADIPDEHHGLRSKCNKENSEMYQREMHKIRAGMKYSDQSTPLVALLTALGSAMNGDTDLYKEVALMTLSPDEARKYAENSKYWADQLDFLSTPQWPDNPGNGYVHTIYLCRKGSLIDEIAQRMVYEDGKWYSHHGKFKDGVAEHATSEEISAAKAKGYLCDWEIAGPYIRRGKGIKDKNHKELFDIPFGPELPDVDVQWQSVKVEPYKQHPASVNITSALLSIDQSVAYLRTEIVSDIQKQARLEIYTDDGVIAWLNGEIIHENNNSRGIEEEPDTVNVTLKQGVNRLMLKVTEDIWGSRAIVRLRTESPL